MSNFSDLKSLTYEEALCVKETLNNLVQSEKSVSDVYMAIASVAPTAISGTETAKDGKLNAFSIIAAFVMAITPTIEIMSGEKPNEKDVLEIVSYVARSLALSERNHDINNGSKKSPNKPKGQK